MNKEDNEKLKVGMTMYAHIYNSYSRGNIRGEIAITKIGRKWIYLDNIKADIDTWRISGGQYGSPGRLYLSYLDYLEEKQLIDDWKEFRRVINISMKAIVTVERIKQCRELLGI